MKRIRTILLIIIIICFLTALFLSGQSSEDSVQLTDNVLTITSDLGFFAKTQFGMAVIYYSVMFRKFLHFIMYAVATLPLYLYVFTYVKSVRKAAVITLACVLLFAGFDEVRQMLAAGRNPQVSDVLIDTAGGLFTLFVIAVSQKVTNAIHQARVGEEFEA